MSVPRIALRIAVPLVSLILVALSCLPLTTSADPKRWFPAVAAFEVIPPPPHGAVLVVGSSSIRRWSTVEEDLAPLTILHRGFGGSRLVDVLYWFDQLIAQHKPRAVLVYEGDNDLSAGLKPGLLLDEYHVFDRMLRDVDPAIRLYVISIKPSPARAALWPQARQANELLAQWCDEHPMRYFIDVATPLLNESGEPSERFTVDDRLHLNAEGYARWTEAIRAVLIPGEGPFETESRREP